MTHLDFRSGLEALRAAQKPSRGTPAYSRHVNRPLGRVVAAAMNSRGLSPNQATAVSAALSASGIALIALARPTWWLGVLIAVLLAAGYVMDSVDGQLARLSGGGSKSGEWLDHTVDCFKSLTLHLSVLIGWYRFGELSTDAWLLVPIGFTVVAGATYFGLILMPTLRPPGGSDREDRPAEHVLRRFLILPTDYGFICWVFVLWGAPAVFRGVWLFLFAAAAGMLALALVKWWRELRALDGVTA